VDIDTSGGHFFKDVIFETNGASDNAIEAADDTASIKIFKSRFFNYAGGIFMNSANGDVSGFVKDSLFDGNSVSSSFGIGIARGANVTIEETEFKNHSLGDFNAAGAASLAARYFGRNLILSSNTQFDQNNFSPFTDYFMEDFKGVVGDNFQFLGLTTVEDQQLIRSTTTPVRSGGGATSIEVLPSTDISSNWEFSQLLLFEYPIYTDTTSRDYQVFFKSGTSTGAFTASPTADELWVECEYWGSSSENFRKLDRTTATMDFTTDSDFDQSLTITCNPSQTGILYLRGWYAKPLESGRVNEFFVDPRPVITDT